MYAKRCRFPPFIAEDSKFYYNLIFLVKNDFMGESVIVNTILRLPDPLPNQRYQYYLKSQQWITNDYKDNFNSIISTHFTCKCAPAP